MNGKEVIKLLAKMLNKQGKLTTDTNIVILLRSLNEKEIKQLIDSRAFGGDVAGGDIYK